MCAQSVGPLMIALSFCISALTLPLSAKAQTPKQNYHIYSPLGLLYPVKENNGVYFPDVSSDILGVIFLPISAADPYSRWTDDVTFQQYHTIRNSGQEQKPGDGPPKFVETDKCMDTDIPCDPTGAQPTCTRVVLRKCDQRNSQQWSQIPSTSPGSFALMNRTGNTMCATVDILYNWIFPPPPRSLPVIMQNCQIPPAGQQIWGEFYVGQYTPPPP
jgi:hypothetical protein